MTDQDDTQEDKGLKATQASALHRGDRLKDSEFELTYDTDSEGYYHLRYQHEVFLFSHSFTRVERTGENTWNLAGPNQRAGLFLKDIENYPLLRKAMVTLARSTPDKPKKDR